MELLVTDQIKQKIPRETREHFIEKLPRIKEVNVLVEKLDDFLGGCKTVKLHKAQNSMKEEGNDNK